MVRSLTRRNARIAVLAAALAMPMLSMVPANANSYSCSSGWNCVWANANFVGGPGHFGGTTHSWTTQPSGTPSTGYVCVPGISAASDDTNDSWNDCVTSMSSNETATMYYYENAGCKSGGGWYATLADGYHSANVGSTINDAISSNDASGLENC